MAQQFTGSARTVAAKAVRGRSRLLVAPLLVVAALAAGCGGGGATTRSVSVAPAAVADSVRLLGGVGRAVEASADDVSRLSSQAGVSEDVVRVVAPQLDQQPVWKRSFASARRAYARVPDEVKEPVTSVACQVVSGQITTREEFINAVAEQFDVGNMGRSEIEATLREIDDLYQALVEARNSPDPEERATAVLLCFTVEQVQE